MDSEALTFPAAEIWTWLRNSLRPSPSFTHFLLTHGYWIWEFVNATFIREILMRLVLTGGCGAGPSNLGNLAFDKSSGWRNYDCQIKQGLAWEEAGKWGVTEVGTACHHYFCSAVRSNLIPSPPTYNSAHDYISWESFSNVSYYTRILPSVPKDCPTPMGTKGKEGAVARN